MAVSPSVDDRGKATGRHRTALVDYGSSRWLVLVPDMSNHVLDDPCGESGARGWKNPVRLCSDQRSQP